MDILKKAKEMARKDYSIGLYTGGVDVNKWADLSQSEKQKALSKAWYVRWSYRNPKTGNLVRMKNLKGGVNYQKTMSGRMEGLRALKKAMQQLLDEGDIPQKLRHLYNEINTDKAVLGKNSHVHCSIVDALEKAIKYKESQELAESTIKDYKKARNSLLKFIGSENWGKDISEITKSTINQYLISLQSRDKPIKPKTLNNYRSSLSALFSAMSGKLELIDRNFIKEDIEVLEAKSEKNTAYTPSEVKMIFELAKEKDEMLYHYLGHVFLGLFRLKEVVLIQANHVNLEMKRIQSDTKTYKMYKQIPEVLIDRFYSKYDLKSLGDKFMFTKDGEPSYNYSGKKDKNGNLLITKADQRRRYWTDRFNSVVRDPLGIFTSNHTANSLRHSGIGVLFLTLLEEYKEKEYIDYEDRALQAVMKHTAHDTTKAVRRYLREIGYYNIPDWSDKINKGFY